MISGGKTEQKKVERKQVIHELYIYIYIYIYIVYQNKQIHSLTPYETKICVNVLEHIM